MRARGSQQSQPQRDVNGGKGGSREASLIEVFGILLEYMRARHSKTSELMNILLQRVAARDGSKAFPPDVISATVERVIQEPSTPASTTPEASSVPAPELVESRPDFVIEVLRALATRAGLPLIDVLGQVLWQHRRAEPLREPRLRRIVEDASWVLASAEPSAKGNGDVDAGEDVERVFWALTGPSGRMRYGQWRKTVQLVLRNPVLEGRVRVGDTDRLFCGEVRRNSQIENKPRSGLTVGLGDFKRLLLQLAETGGTHPCMVFLAVGAHARPLEAAAEAPSAS